MTRKIHFWPSFCWVRYSFLPNCHFREFQQKRSKINFSHHCAYIVCICCGVLIFNRVSHLNHFDTVGLFDPWSQALLFSELMSQFRIEMTPGWDISVFSVFTSQCKKKIRYVWCPTTKIERKSSILCQKCNVPLCMPCFTPYHTLLGEIEELSCPNFPVFNISLIFFFRFWQWGQDSVKMIQTDSATSVVNQHLLKKSAALQAIK